MGTFTSSIGLWDRVKDRRKQIARDKNQDEEIKKLRAQIQEAEGKARNSEGPHRVVGDQIGDSLHNSGLLISREFDNGYKQLGRRFAVGDAVTENKLQAQIIALQQTVIDVLQEALYNDRRLGHQDIAKLLEASNAARDRSLAALRQQRQRQLMMLEARPGSELVPWSGHNSNPTPSTVSHAASSVAQRLFCPYSIDLQDIINKPLAASFSPGADGRCPACRARPAVRPSDCWGIERRVRLRHRSYGGKCDAVEEREYQFGQRFVVKCHMPDGGYACVLCNKFREVDTICRDVDDLVDHLGKDHEVEEFEQETDFSVRSRVRPLSRGLPAP